MDITRRSFLRLALPVAVGVTLISGRNPPHQIADTEGLPKAIEELALDRVYIVSKQETDAAASTDPKYPTVDDKVYLHLVVSAKKHGNRIFFSDISDIAINGEKIPAQQIERWNPSNHGPLDIGWLKVEPADNNLTNRGLRQQWEWARIPYIETPFSTNDWSTRADVNPTVLPSKNGRGTMRYKVQVNYHNHTLSSPGSESYGYSLHRLNDNVHRISVRGNTGVPMIDWAFSFMNQPYIWGSESPTGKDEDHQAENFAGADCADFVTAAARKAGYNISYGGSFHFQPNNSRGYTRFICRRPKLNEEDGIYYENGNKVRIGENGVHLGDLVLYDGHIGILVEGADPSGYLSSKDLIVHTLFREPLEIPISEAYAPDFSIVRIKDELLQN